MTCPDCGADVARYDVEQPPLLPDGDTTVTAYVNCPRCGWTGQHATTPPRNPL